MTRTKRIVAGFAVAVLATLGLTLIATGPAGAAGNLAKMVLSFDAPGKCLDITGVSQSNGALAQIYDCQPGAQTNQQFYFFYVPGSGTPGMYQIVARHSGKCLDVVGASTSAGALVQQYDCLGYSQLNQLWTRVDSGTSYVRFYSSNHTNLWLRPNGFSNGSSVVVDSPYVIWQQIAVS